jgi:hypothetical protein
MVASGRLPEADTELLQARDAEPRDAEPRAAGEQQVRGRRLGVQARLHQAGEAPQAARQNRRVRGEDVEADLKPADAPKGHHKGDRS